MRPFPSLAGVALLLVACSPLRAGRAPEVPAARERQPGPEVLVRRPPLSTGGLDLDRAGLAVHRSRAPLARCYRQAGGAAAGRGVVYALADLRADGTVARATVGYSDLRDRRFERCVERVLGEVEMPATGEASVVQLHLVFGAGDEDEGRSLLGSYRARRGSGEPPRSEPVSLAGLRGRIQPCYERALRGQPGLRGRTELHLVLEADGSISEAAFTSGVELGEGLGRCVLGVVRTLRLRPEDASVATLTYPVVFQ